MGTMTRQDPLGRITQVARAAAVGGAVGLVSGALYGAMHGGMYAVLHGQLSKLFTLTGTYAAVGALIGLAAGALTRLSHLAARGSWHVARGLWQMDHARWIAQVKQVCRSAVTRRRNGRGPVVWMRAGARPNAALHGAIRPPGPFRL